MFIESVLGNIFFHVNIVRFTSESNPISATKTKNAFLIPHQERAKNSDHGTNFLSRIMIGIVWWPLFAPPGYAYYHPMEHRPFLRFRRPGRGWTWDLLVFVYILHQMLRVTWVLHPFQFKGFSWLEFQLELQVLVSKIGDSKNQTFRSQKANS